MRAVAACLGLCLLGCASSNAPGVQHPHGYRAQTITTDVVGTTALTLGIVSLHAVDNESLQSVLLTGGILVAGLGDSVIHLAHDHPGRAVGTLLFRVGTVTSGMMFGVALKSCQDGCTEGMLWGTAAGLAAAGVIDALVLHYDSKTWSPTVVPADGGARVGVAAQF